MAVYFFDSSAIVKRYVREVGSTWIDSLLDPSANHTLHIATVTGAEVVAAIARRFASIRAPKSVDFLVDEFRDDYANTFRKIEIGQTIIKRAMQLAQKHRLRGYDAMQLAAAAEIHLAYAAASQKVTIVSADDELNAAAMSEGLLVENPNFH